ncbi:MAG: 4-alpha-glucanotransferase [Oceanipulchritudo sp.]
MAGKTPPLAWLTERAAGVLLHPSSLPGDQGIGTLGPAAFEFIDLLVQSGIRYWQVLPLGPTGYGDCPYSSFSAFAGNPYLIDIQALAENGILQAADLEPLRNLPAEHADFGSLYRIKWPLLRLAHKRFVEQGRAYLPNYGYLEEFTSANAAWLEPFCSFMALKERFAGAFWGDWPEQCQTPQGARKSSYWAETKQGRQAHAFFQYLFFGQWNQLRKYAGSVGIRIIGDVPIFVALDSADTWSSPELFEMATPGRPDFVAGVPPDYFSKTGQLWGNPLYDWKAMAENGFAWWIERLKSNFSLFDVVRLDHFRGFYDYWRIPAGSGDARAGKWASGPRMALFKEIPEKIPGSRLIAEDLGEIHEGVREFRDRLGLPGMAILQFAFGGGADNLYLPHNLVPDSVVYPGTHDNNTTRGWYESSPPGVRDHVRRYLRVDGSGIAWDFIRWAYQSTSRLAVIAAQDLLSLGTGARMNEPGLEQGNWQWRMTGSQFNSLRDSAHYLQELARLYGRAREK